MTGGGSIINLGELSKPLTVLIEKISDATGGLFRPFQIRRVARAEADADRIRAISQIEITELQQRAILRLVTEEAKKQANMESITEQEIPLVKEDAKTENVDNDWILHFFDKCRIVSDEEMQALWARVLAGEANSPGSYSKKTLTVLSDLDRPDAERFAALCRFAWTVGNIVPLVFKHDAAIYETNGVTFESLVQLENIGLIRFEHVGGFKHMGLPKRPILGYYGRPLRLELTNEEDNELQVGHVILTRIGQELARICGSTPVEGFWEYVLGEWKTYLPKAEDETAIAKEANPVGPTPHTVE
jgi:hypothetical protein